MEQNIRLSEVLSQTGKAQNAIAKEIGTTPQSLSNWKAGITPPLAKAIILARKLNTTVEDLWGHLVH